MIKNYMMGWIWLILFVCQDLILKLYHIGARKKGNLSKDGEESIENAPRGSGDHDFNLDSVDIHPHQHPTQTPQLDDHPQVHSFPTSSILTVGSAWLFTLQLMKIRSSYFKKQYDLQKAELVGKGTFAQVFRVFDSDLKDSIAIRKVQKSMADIQDIAKEKQINQELRKVENQNILKIFDIIQQPDTVWYITEYCSGGSLWDALNLCKDNKLNEKESLECILQISKGVQELHNHRITHRDLKPENILLKTKYVPGKPLPLIKLADFGLSTQKIIMETIAGTKEYIAPQQAKFHNYTNAVDVWSLGIIFDEILHGNPFYSGEDNKEVFNKILKTPFKVRDESIRPSIKDLLTSLLKKKPYERPIIAVIRSTIEKILQEISGGSHMENELQIHKKPSIQSLTGTYQVSKLNNDSKISSVSSQVKITNLSKQNIGAFSKKTYQVGVQEKPVLSKDSPINKEANVFSKAMNSQRKMMEINLKVSAPLVNTKKDQVKSAIRESTQTKGNEKLTVTLKTENAETDRSKIQKRPISRVESASKSPQVAVITDKITIFKQEKRKLINSNVKKEEYKNDIISLNTYAERINTFKNQLANTGFSLEKELSFIPNTFLTGNDYIQKCGSSEPILKDFRKRFDCLNYINLSEDYEIRLMIAQRQLKQRRQISEDELYKVQYSVKQVFFTQLDSFIDQFLDKVIK